MNPIFKFYIFNSKLKNIVRTGWLDVKISADRLESVAEHAFGTMILAITINSEKKLNLDINKIMKMLLLHELEEILIGDYSYLIDITREEKLELGKKAVKELVYYLNDSHDIENLLIEFNSKSTEEAKFAYYCDKLECDFQAKLYDLQGVFDIEEEIKDCKSWNKENSEEIIKNNNTASGMWIDCNEGLYKDSELFTELVHEIKNITADDYKKILDIKLEDKD